MGAGGPHNTRMNDIAQLKYSLGTGKKKIWIPVPLPNMQWNKNVTAPKGEWEGQSPFPYGLMAWELRKSDEPKVQTSQPVFCLLGLKK